MEKNIITNTDSYKVGMFLQYPENTTTVYSYVESRGGNEDELVFFGLQYFIKEYLMKPVTKADVLKAERLMKVHGEPFNKEGWMRIVEKHDGYLPLAIKALPEGSIVKTKTVMATIYNTDPEFPWLTTWVETPMLRAIWYPTTVATNSRAIKKMIKRNLEKTGDVAGLLFKLHDFGARGAHTFESAGIGGAAHLVNFMGTDTISGLEFAMDYYGAELDSTAFSVPATEHSISTAFGPDQEVEYLENHIDKSLAAGMKIISAVSDTYDIWNFVQNVVGGALKEKVIALGDVGATLVVRPDSGDPTYVPVKVIELLMNEFGYTVNDKGYKVLPPYIRVIQGDGIDKGSIAKIYEMMEEYQLSGDNITFGMGGKLLGAPQRDDQKFAMKASYVVIDGVGKNISKSPITDPVKKSKEGKFCVIKDDNGDFITVAETEENLAKDELGLVFENGRLIYEWKFDQVRANAAM